jgi:hypothetical protein
MSRRQSRMPSLPLRLRRRGRHARAGGDMKATAHKGTTKKHAGTKKHTGTTKHRPTATIRTTTTVTTARKTVRTVVVAPAPAKPRKLSPGYDVACCSALAVAESLRLSGRPVGADDVFALYWRTACDPEAGATVLDTLRAAQEFGLAGVRPVSFRVAGPGDWSLILGLELPGAHAVLAESGRWWSWSQPWPPAAFPDAVIEEAWAVTWP